MTWYGFDRARKRLSDYGDMSDGDLRRLWETLWFDKSPRVDADLATRFTKALDCMLDYRPANAIETIGMIILYDQIPRNVFRGTPKAYVYDALALRFAKEFVAAKQTCPLFVRVTLVLCFIHSEDLSDQEWAAKEVAVLLKQHPHCSVLPTLKEISLRHMERVSCFGRIPERARIKGLDLTDAERLYLQEAKL